MTHLSQSRTQSSGTWIVGLIGAAAVSALLAAMVWVVEGQVQQGQVLRAQWHTSARAADSGRQDVERNDAMEHRNAVVMPRASKGMVAVAFDRP